MTVVAKGRFRTLAVYPTGLGFGWVVCEGPFQLIESGVFATLDKGRPAASARKLVRLIKRIRPGEFVIEAYDQRKPPVRAIAGSLVNAAADRGLFVEAHSRATVQRAFEAVGARTREDIAAVLARHFPALALRLPKRRRPWEGEDKRLAIFNAAAVVIAHYHNGATALLDERGSAA